MLEEKEPQYRMKKIIENGAIKYVRVPLNPADELEEKNLEISRLKKLIDELRNKIETLEQEQQRQKLIEAGPSDSAESYQIYG
jgi:AmiR/NasT family two-component response regulator